MQKIKLSDVKISNMFKNSPPNEQKMNRIRLNYIKYGVQDKPIVLDKNGFLIDGYARYLILQEFGEEYAKCVHKKNAIKKTPNYKKTPTYYIYGLHSGCDKEFVWRIPRTRIDVLNMFYMPNARMDRTKNSDEVFTLKYFSDVINWLGFDEIHVIDIHSDVGKALLNKCYCGNVKLYIAYALGYISEGKLSNVVLYFPDSGSAKRYLGLFEPNAPYCYGEKKRDWNTGKILGLEIQDNGIDLKDKTILMIDDIISYGGSLYYSAKALKEIGVGKIYAYATHTENSILDKEKGTLIKALENNTVKKLFTTNSLFTGKHEKIEVMEIKNEKH